jgi:DNA-binding NtrC family response regulator
MTQPPPDPLPPRRERWTTLLQDSTRPVFVLYRTRRIRFVNAAWEKLTGRTAADAMGRGCVRSGSIEPIFRALAPPREALEGKLARVRRAVPPNKGGPPWWDITFLPLSSSHGPSGFIGWIDLIPTEVGITAKKQLPPVANIREKLAAAYPFDLFRSTTPAGQRLMGQIHLAAQTTVPVWIVGESGSGKETLARVIHQNSTQRERPFVACDCYGLQPYLIDSILFGLGGLATNEKIGTLFLKNPAHLPRDLQLRILDWLVAANHPPRLICSSKLPAPEEVRTGKLLSDFCTDFSVLELRLPPLREQLDDITRLASRWPVSLGDDCLPVLRSHHWPGNIRELYETLLDARTEAGGQKIAVSHLPRYLRERALLATNPVVVPNPKWNLDAVLKAVETRMIEAALTRANGNQTEAAKLLGIFRTRLARRVGALEIGQELG